MFRRAAQMPQRVDVRYQLASALHGRGKAGDFQEAAELLCALAHEQGVPAPLRVSIIGMATDCFVRDQRLGEAEAFIGGFSAGDLTSLAALTFRALLKFERDDRVNAGWDAEAALALVTADSDDAELDHLARLLNNLGRHKEALPL